MSEALHLALTNARNAARGRRWSEACDAVLAAWRMCFDPDLIGIMDDIYARANLPGMDEGAHHGAHGGEGAWIARATTSDPLDVAALCAAPSSVFVGVAMTRATKLLTRPPDPRIARWAAQQLDQHYQSALARVWLELLELHGDAQIEATLRPVYGRPGTTPAVPDALDDLGAIRRTLRTRQGRAPAALVVSVRMALVDAPAQLDLLGVIYDDPDDLDARAVYADYLAQSGDPQGEFISLGLAAAHGFPGARAAAEAARLAGHKRATVLWQAHYREWYGPLVDIMAPALVSCRAGFLERLTCNDTGGGAGRSLRIRGSVVAAVTGAPCWQTVRSVNLERAPMGLSPVLAHPVCRHVTRVTHFNERDYGDLAGATVPWRDVGLVGPVGLPTAHPRLPNLETVTLAEQHPWLDCALPLWGTVERITLIGGLTSRHDPARWAIRARWMPSLRRVWLAATPAWSDDHLELVRAEDGSWGATGGRLGLGSGS